MKKFISMALALVMTLSLCTFVAVPEADAFTDTDELSQYAKQAIDVIQTIDVMAGYDDDTFKPEATLTRQAAAKIICNMILGPVTAKSLPTNEPPFPDVNAGTEWAGYIAYCSHEGIINGYSDGTFKPTGALTGYAFLKMLLGALGYSGSAEGFTGGNWKVNVAKIALGIGLNQGITSDPEGENLDQGVTREDAAIYSFNTLQGDLMEYPSQNTININGVAVSMGNGKATPQTWNTSSTSANYINDRTSDGANARPIVQFAERYFDKLERFPKQWDTYTQDDFGRPSIKWKWRGVDIGTYSRTPDATFVGGVKVNEIYQALVDNAGMSSGSSSASLYVNSGVANRGWYQSATRDYTGNPGGYGEFKVERANDRDLEKEIARNTTGANTGLTPAGANDVAGGRTNAAGAYIGRNVDRIGDGTLIEAFLNEATNHVDVCVISVYAGKVDAVKGATAKKDAYVVITVSGDPAKRPDSIMNNSGNREYETVDFDEEDVVAYTYSDSAASIKSMYLMESESGTLQSKVSGKSLKLDDTVYSYGKEYTFNDLTEANLSNKSSYILYLDENDYVLWIEEDEFSVDDYVLIERITIETTVNNVTTKTASVLGLAETNPGYTGPNAEKLQKAYNQSKDAVGNSSWDAQAQLRYSNGTRRTVTLDDSKNYRTSVASDNANVTTVTPLTTDSQGFPVDANNDRVSVTGTTGDDGNWIAEPFTAGHIARISSNNNGYRLHSINAARFYKVNNFSLTKNQIHESGGAVTDGTTTITADSETHFAVDDLGQGSYKPYVGVKNAPTVNLVTSGVHAGDNAVAYIYHTGGSAKMVFVTNAWDVSNSSNDIVFLVANSTSNLIESDDGEYYEISAVVKNEPETVMVKRTTPLISFSANGNTFTPGQAGSDKETNCVILNNVSYDSNDFITKGSFSSTDLEIGKYQGVRRVNDEEVRLNTAPNMASRLMDVAENIRVYFVDGGDIEQIEYDEIVNDTQDMVYYVADDGEVTYLFIVDYEGSGTATTTVTTYTVDATTKVATGYKVALPSGVTSVTGGQALSFQVMDASNNPMTSANIAVTLQYTSTDNGFTKTVDASESSGVWSLTIPSDIRAGTDVVIVVTAKS